MKRVKGSIKGLLLLFVYIFPWGGGVVRAGSPPKVPEFLTQPPRFAFVNKIFEYRFAAEVPDRRPPSKLKLLKGPPSAQVYLTHWDGCCTIKGRLQWLPSRGDMGKKELVLEITSAGGTRAVQSFTVEVMGINAPPTLNLQLPSAVVAGSTVTIPLRLKDPDPKDTPSFAILERPPGMELVKGILRWTPSPAQIGLHPLTIATFDQRGAQKLYTYLLKVSPPPPQTAIKLTAPPPQKVNSGKLFIYKAVPKPRGDGNYSYTLIKGPAGMKFIGPFLVWKADKKGTFPVEFVIKKSGLTDKRVSFSLEVKSANNNPPKFVKLPETTLKSGETLQTELKLNDPDGDPISLTVEEGPERLQVNSSVSEPDKFTLSYRALPGEFGRHPVRLRAEDGRGGITYLQFDLHIIKKNSPPKFLSTPIPQAVPGREYTYHPQVYDPDGDTEFFFTLTDAPPGMTVDPLTGLLSWNPEGEGKKYRVQISVRDSQGAWSHQIFNIRVVDVNTPPQWLSTPPERAVEGRIYRYAPKVKDPDPDGGGNLSFRIATGPYGMKIGIQTGEVTWIPQEADVGKHHISLEVCDSRGGCSRQEFTVQVLDQNDSPKIVSTPPQRARANELYLYRIRVRDPDTAHRRESLRFSLLTGPAGAKVDPKLGILTWKPPDIGGGNRIPPFKFKVAVSDSSGATDTQSWSVELLPPNRPPQLKIPPELELTQGTEFKLKLQAKDPEGGQVYWTVVEAPAGLKIVNGDTLSWTPTPLQIGKSRLLLRVSDSGGNNLLYPVTLKVKNINDKPVISGVYCTQKGDLLTCTSTARDLDPGDENSLVWSLQNAPAGMTIDSQTGRIRYKLTPPVPPVLSFQVRVTDPAGESDIQKFLIPLRTDNSPPSVRATSPPIDITEGMSWSFQIQATDGDGDTLYFYPLQLPRGAELFTHSGVIRWSVPFDAAGTHELLVAVSDRRGNVTPATVKLKVKDKNRPPLFSHLPPKGGFSGKKNTYYPRVSDPDGDPVKLGLSYFPTSLPTPPTLSPQGHQLNWVPSKGRVTSDVAVVFRAHDGRGGVDWFGFLWKLNTKTDRPPQWILTPPKMARAIRGQLYTQKLRAEDPEGGPVFYRLEQGPEEAEIDQFSGSLFWTPRKNQTGIFTLTVRAEDAGGNSSAISWKVDVRPGGSAPKFLSNPLPEAHGGKKYIYRVKVVDPDPNDKVTVQLVRGPKGSYFHRQSSSVVWTPPASQSGPQFFKLRATDSQNNWTEQEFSVLVHPSGTPPKFVKNLEELQILEDRQFSYQLKVIDPDPEDRVTFQIVSGPAGLKLQPRTGLLTWKPSNGDVGLHIVKILAADRYGNTDEMQLSLRVIDENDPPKFISRPCTTTTIDGYHCILWAKDPDPTPQILIAKKISGPPGIQIKTERADRTSGINEYAVTLDWKTTARDVGLHQIAIELSDGQSSTLLNFTLEVTPKRDLPTAVINAPGEVFPGEVILDGTESIGADGRRDNLLYTWEFVRGPQEVPIPQPFLPKISVLLKKAGLYVFSLKVQKDGKSSQKVYARIRVKNIPPTAEASAPRAAKVGQKVVIDARESADPNGDKVVLFLRQITKLKIDKIVQNGTSFQFTPLEAGIYRFSLIAEEEGSRDGRLRSKPREISIAVHDPDGDSFIPHPVIIAPSRGVIGENITLDGSRSRDILDEKLNTGLLYNWRIVSGPDGAKLLTPNSSKTIFTAKKPGYYRIELTVKNSSFRSLPQVVGIEIFGERPDQQIPTASISDGVAMLYNWFTLNGSNSFSPDRSQLSFRWVQTGGPAVQLEDQKSARPKLFPLNLSRYRFQLTVRGKGPESPPTTAEIRVNRRGNGVPEAHIETGGKSFVIKRAGQLVTLDGSGSRDPDGHKLLFRWEQLDGFPTPLITPNESKLSFIPLTYGILKFKLQVYDGITWSAPKFVDVVVNSEKNSVPIADAGPDKVVRLLETVTLDGSKSYDLDSGDKLLYRWRLIYPKNYSLPINLVDPTHPSFTPTDPKIKKYVFGLRVDDGKILSLEDTVTITVKGENNPPLARIRVSGVPIVGNEIIFDGSESYDADGDSLTFLWAQTSGPTLQISDPNAPSIKIKPQKSGIYQFQLIVNDGLANSPPASISIQVKEAEDLPAGCGCDSSSGLFRLPLYALLLLLLIPVHLFQINRKNPFSNTPEN